MEPGERCAFVAHAMAHVCQTAFLVTHGEGGKSDIQVHLAAGAMTLSLEDQGMSTDSAHAIKLGSMTAVIWHSDEVPSLARVHAMRDTFFNPTGPPVGLASTGSVALLEWVSALVAAGHLEAYDCWLFAGAFPVKARAYEGSHGPQGETFLAWLVAHLYQSTRAVLGEDCVVVLVPEPGSL